MAEQQQPQPQEQQQVEISKVMDTVLDIIAGTKASTSTVINYVSIYSERDYMHVTIHMHISDDNKLLLHKYVREYRTDNKVEYQLRLNGIEINLDQHMHAVLNKLYEVIANNKQVQAIFCTYNVLKTLTNANLVEVYPEILI